jgi:hypothetical protein
MNEPTAHEWHACMTNRGSAHEQGLIIDSKTGANIAVAYDPNHAPLIAASPDALAVVRTLFCEVNGLNATLRATDSRYAASALCAKLTDTVRMAREAIDKASLSL